MTDKRAVLKVWLALAGTLLLAGQLAAQEPEPAPRPETGPAPAAANPAAQASSSASGGRTEPASVNLRTTVTGSQEQPRVLYIMPWQSPDTPDLGLQSLSSQPEAVFGHLEREELVRRLEAAGDFDEDQADAD